MKKYLFVLLFVFIFSYLIFPFFPVYASVILNEIAIIPTQAVELYNNASTSADISGWYIDDAGGSTYFSVPPQTLLAPQSCVVFTTDFNFNKSSQDLIRLFDSSSPPTTTSAKLIESYGYSKAPDTGYSFSKIKDGGAEWQTNLSSLGLFNESFTSCIPTPSPSPIPTETPSPTSTTAPSPTPDTLTPTPFKDYSNILISELYAYPAPHEHEWIELYNNNEFQVCLDHWYLDDGDATGSAPKQLSTCIDPFAYIAIDFTTSLFNNSGDTARLLNHDRVEKDSMEYGKHSESNSVGRVSFDADEYCEQTPSKGKANTDCLAPPTPLPTKVVVSSPRPTKHIIASQEDQKSYQSNTAQAGIVSRQLQPYNTPEGEILGLQTEENLPPSPLPYTTGVSFSYSLLTIVSIFIKMKNA